MVERPNGPSTEMAGVEPDAPGRRLDDDVTEEDPVEIREDIRATRERMSDTIEEIGERLNPHHITEKVKDNLRDATIGKVEHMARNAADAVTETRHTLIDTIRENSLPAALVGIGLGWLFVNGRARRSSGGAGRQFDDRSQYRYGGRSQYALGDDPTARYAYEGSAYGSEVGYGREYGSGYRSEEEEGALGRVRGKAGEIGGEVKHTASELAERAQQAAEEARERASEVASTVAERTRERVTRVEDRYYESPLAVGAATLALGLAAGMALPVSDREVRFMGDARDRVVDRVRGAARETTDKVQDVATRVAKGVETLTEGTARREERTS